VTAVGRKYGSNTLVWCGMECVYMGECTGVGCAASPPPRHGLVKAKAHRPCSNACKMQACMVSGDGNRLRCRNLGLLALQLW